MKDDLSPEDIQAEIDAFSARMHPQASLYDQIYDLALIANEIQRHPHREYLVDALAPQYAQMISYAVSGEGHLLEILQLSTYDPDNPPLAAGDIGMGAGLELFEWARNFAVRWGLASEADDDPGKVDPNEFPFGWFEVGSSIGLQEIATATTQAAEDFLQLWQRCSLVHEPGFLFDEDQRFRLIQACEALLGVLRAGLVERNLAASVQKRSRLVEVAIAAVLAGVTGAVGAGVTTGVDAFSAKKKAEAEATVTAARSLSQCLQILDRSLTVARPETSPMLPGSGNLHPKPPGG